jgi:hypothetical protein
MPRDSEEIHGPGAGQGEHAMCGLAFDAHDSGDHSVPVVFAKPGEVVTCETCRMYIEHVFARFTSGYRVRK